MKRFSPTIIASLAFVCAVGVVSAWTGPTASPPSGNASAPLNVGSASQVKNGSIGVNGLAVFGNTNLGGGLFTDAYLNFGLIPTAGVPSSGYGFWDNAGVISFKNLGGSWQSLSDLASTSVRWTITDNGVVNFNTYGGPSTSLTTFVTNIVNSTSSSIWTKTGNNIYYNAGKVGIGTASPAHELDVVGTASASTQINTPLLCDPTGVNCLNPNPDATYPKGSLIFAACSPSVCSNVSYGQIVSGSNLSPAWVAASSYSVNYTVTGSTGVTLPGNWKCLGSLKNPGAYLVSTLFVRVN